MCDASGDAAARGVAGDAKREASQQERFGGGTPHRIRRCPSITSTSASSPPSPRSAVSSDVAGASADASPVTPAAPSALSLPKRVGEPSMEAVSPSMRRVLVATSAPLPRAADAADASARHPAAVPPACAVPGSPCGAPLGRVLTATAAPAVPASPCGRGDAFQRCLAEAPRAGPVLTATAAPVLPQGAGQRLEGDASQRVPESDASSRFPALQFWLLGGACFDAMSTEELTRQLLAASPETYEE